MKLYDISLSATCPPGKRWLWEQEVQNGYTLAVFGTTVRLEGRNKTEEDFLKITHLVDQFPDHHIVVKEVKTQ